MTRADLIRMFLLNGCNCAEIVEFLGANVEEVAEATA